jgi:heat-inducible transcriptional repressor
MAETTPALDERSREVLRLLIQHHIQTGEPVGSETLAARMNRALSPATLRNIMADLERHGLLDHPHTSAGRLPTDEGYRVYVDSLMAYEDLPRQELFAIDQALRSKEGSPNQVLENASQLLSRLSRHVGFVLAPDVSKSCFSHIDLVRLRERRILVVMVSRSGLVTNKVVELDEDLQADELQECSNYLNARFAGMMLHAIRLRLIELMQKEKADYDSLLRHVISVGERAFAEAEGDGSNVFLDGTSHILEHAEGPDLARLRELFRTFEEKSRLVKILNACIADEGVRILIGRENPEPGLREMALVTAACPIDGELGLGVGVLGSTRMEYARVIALVDHVARAVSRALRELQA